VFAVDPLMWGTVIATIHWEEWQVRETGLYPAVSAAGTSCYAGRSHFGGTGSSVDMVLPSAGNSSLRRLFRQSKVMKNAAVSCRSVLTSRRRACGPRRRDTPGAFPLPWVAAAVVYLF